MKYCQECKSTIDDSARFCPYCGAESTVPHEETQQNQYQQNQYQQNQYQRSPYQSGYQGATDPNDTGSSGWTVLGFFIPLAGLILYLIWKDTQPKNAQKAGKGALIGVITNAAILFITILCTVITNT